MKLLLICVNKMFFIATLDYRNAKSIMQFKQLYFINFIKNYQHL